MLFRSDLEAQRIWVQWLERTARQHLSAAVESLPTRDSSRVFAQARAESRLNVSLSEEFGALRLRPGKTMPKSEEAAHD